MQGGKLDVHGDQNMRAHTELRTLHVTYLHRDGQFVRAK